MTTKEVADVVDTEGLEYAILHYLDEEDIDSPKLRRAWAKAKKSLNDLIEILEPIDYEGEEDDERCED